MNDTAEVDRKWGVFLSMVTKYEEQSVKHKELTTRMLAEMLAPVEPEPPLNAAPPFEALCIEDIVAGLVRDIQVRMTEPQERDMIRQAGGLFNRLLQSSAFYKAVLETVGKRPMADPELWEVWRRHCHQCRLPTPEEAQKAPFMCDYCQAEFEAGTRVNKDFPLVTKAFGVRFMRAYIEDIKRVTSGMKEGALPPNSKPYLERLVREFEQELQLGPSSFVFRKTSQIRNVLSQPLQQHLRQRDGNNNSNAAKPVPPPPLAPAMPPPPVVPKLVRAPSVNDQLSQLATPPMPKKVKAENDGAPDSFLVKVVNDTKSPAGWELLIGLKEVISKQLPEMPKYYIMRALFDGHHESLCVLKNGKVVGGCTFRPFAKQGFVEVVFLVVNPNTTNKGLGSLIMTEVKTFVHSVIKVDFLLTYADNTAIDFFKKQGFSKDITLARTRWAGYIKDYTKATLMEYHIAPARDAAIAQQAQWVKTCINSTMDSLEVQKFSDKTNKVREVLSIFFLFFNFF
jgi:N-acetylglutamate synthase-like GNAT family acetyltransferase